MKGWSATTDFFCPKAIGVKLFASHIGRVVHYPEKKPKGRVVYHAQTAHGVSPTGKS